MLRPDLDARKDHAKHLRTIHFALVVGSFSVLLFALTPPPEELRRALAEAQAGALIADHVAPDTMFCTLSPVVSAAWGSSKSPDDYQLGRTWNIEGNDEVWWSKPVTAVAHIRYSGLGDVSEDNPGQFDLTAVTPQRFIPFHWEERAEFSDYEREFLDPEECPELWRVDVFRRWWNGLDDVSPPLVLSSIDVEAVERVRVPQPRQGSVYYIHVGGDAYVVRSQLPEPPNTKFRNVPHPQDPFTGKPRTPREQAWWNSWPRVEFTPKLDRYQVAAVGSPYGGIEEFGSISVYAAEAELIDTTPRLVKEMPKPVCPRALPDKLKTMLESLSRRDDAILEDKSTYRVVRDDSGPTPVVEVKVVQVAPLPRGIILDRRDVIDSSSDCTISFLPRRIGVAEEFTLVRVSYTLRYESFEFDRSLREVALDGLDESLIDAVADRRGEFAALFPNLVRFLPHPQGAPTDQEDLGSDRGEHQFVVSFRSLGDVLKRYIEYERASGSFKIVGVEVPRQLIRNAGLWVLATLQLYFAMHLMYFRPSRSMDPFLPPSVPWIGLYRHWIPTLVLFGSTFILPLAAGSLVAWQSRETEDAFSGGWLVTVVGFVALSVASSFLGVELLRLRKRI